MRIYDNNAADPRKRILLVDDEPFILNIMESFLDPAIYLVDTANCGHDALRLLNQNTYDCLVTDVRMPDISGIEILRQVKATKNPIPAIIFITGFSEKSVRDLMALGADGCLIKPFNVEDFVVEVERIIKRKSPVPSFTNQSSVCDT